MLRFNNDDVGDLLVVLGKASIIMYSYHPKVNEIDFVVYAFREEFKKMMQAGIVYLGAEPFTLHISERYAQIVTNIADYLGLQATKEDVDTFSVVKRPSKLKTT